MHPHEYFFFLMMNGKGAGPRLELAPEPEPPRAVTDPRAVAAWRSWLHALATDAEAALAAALAYGSLDAAARDTWLDALEEDAPRIGVPRIALYAPLLSVEDDPERLLRIRFGLGDEQFVPPEQAEARALRGVLPGGARIVVLVLPIYLSFVQVFSCRYHLSEGFSWARHEPFARDADAPRGGSVFEGAPLERTPMKPVVEELAHAVVAHGRGGAPPPDALRVIIDLFSPEIEVVG